MWYVLLVSAPVSAVSGWWLGNLLGGFVKSRRAGNPPEEARYGHPHPPVSAIRKALPDVSYPLQWETWVDESKGVNMVIRLVDLRDMSPLETRNVDLVNGGVLGTWAKQYRDYASIAESTFRNDLVGRARDWAVGAANKHREGESVTNYRMGK